MKLLNNRLDEFQAGRPRVPMIITLRMGCKRDGLLTAKESHIVADTGAFVGMCPAILSQGAIRLDNHYRQKNLRTEGLLVHTHTIPKGAFRGFGGPQMGFAVEQHMDALADAIGMDPAELRLRNCSQAGDTTVHGWKLNSCELERCIRTVVEQSGWKSKRAASAWVLAQPM